MGHVHVGLSLSITVQTDHESKVIAFRRFPFTPRTVVADSMHNKPELTLAKYAHRPYAVYTPARTPRWMMTLFRPLQLIRTIMMMPLQLVAGAVPGNRAMPG